jgi:hypothetical protein
MSHENEYLDWLEKNVPNLDPTQESGMDTYVTSVRHSLCCYCGEWYHIEDYHGSTSPAHQAALMLRGEVEPKTYDQL